MRSKPLLRTLVLNVAASQIKDQVCALLYAYKFIKEHEDIHSIQFDMSRSTKNTDVIPVSVEIRKERKVDIITLSCLKE